MSYENSAARAQDAAKTVGENALDNARSAEPKPHDSSWATPSDTNLPAWATSGADNDADYLPPGPTGVDSAE
ncbi:MAG TPA: hypothetical protein VFZ48_03725 [Candidatus Saccharimonadales bacterium]